ncbi:MAG: GGDEF domain-containing protein [Chloroflexota bacterium]
MAGNPRFRALARSDTRTAAAAGALTLIAVLATDALVVNEVTRGSLAPNVIGIALAALALMLLRGPLRRRPEWVAFGVGLVGVGAALHPMAELPEVRYLMLAYFSLLLVAMALFIPWSPAWHLSFLAVAMGAMALAVASPLGVALDDRFRTDAVMGAFAAVLVSGAGHLVLRRSRLRAFASEMKLRDLHLDTRRQQRELTRLNAELAAVSRRDPLTGVGNRLQMEEDVQELRRDLDKSGRPGAIALIDVDNFKRYNDRFGHVAGDTVLRRVGDAMRAGLRAGDGVYRFGGEEFLLLLPGATLADVQAVLDRLADSVAGLAILHPGNDPWGVITISTGIAPLEGDADSWIRAADQALYRAKDAGRNATAITEHGAVRILRRPEAVAPAA